MRLTKLTCEAELLETMPFIIPSSTELTIINTWQDMISRIPTK